MDEKEDGCVLVHENPSTKIRVHRMSVGDPTTAVKVLGGEHPDPERLKRLYDEYIISRIPVLSRCSAVRAALRHSKRNGSHSICLEWAEGVTLREWVRLNIVTSSRDSLRNTVHLGGVIAGAIAKIHDAGVVHNNITSDNIIVDDSSISNCTAETNGSKEDGGEYFIKLIGLGSAVLLKGNDPVASMFAKQNDLCALGAVLYEMLYGECPSFQKTSGQMLHGKVSILDDAAAGPFPPPSQDLEGKLRSSGIPQCLVMMVSKLLRTCTCKGSTEGFSYQSAKEVKQDLDHICDCPDRFLVGDDGSGVVTGELLEFPSDRLYGRTAELSAVMDAFDRVTRRGGRSEMILISGASGTGKTTLVRHMKEPMVHRCDIFLTGKFDLLRQVQGLSAITAAFTEYFESILVKGGDDLHPCKMALQDLVGTDGISVLNDFVPSLQRVMGPDHSVGARTVVGDKEAQHRLAQMFRLLARAISSKSQRLVLFLDDLQWADVASLDLMKSLIVDNENRFLLIGSYRDNDVDSLDPLSVCVDEIEALGVPITRIEIHDIAEDAINRLISETLRVPLSVSNRLASIVFSRTKGNFFFAKQYLTSLCDVGLLRYSAQSGFWQWDFQQIESIEFVDTAIGLAKQSITKLPVRTQHAVELAACLGFRCDEDILRIVQDMKIGGGSLETRAPMILIRDWLQHLMLLSIDV